MPVVIPVRTHFANQDLWFDPAASGAREGDHVIVTTERGTEFGLATDDPFEVEAAELRSELKSVLRVATDSDIRQAEDLARKGDEAMIVFRRLVKEQELDMKPVGVEFLFGGERAVFYFASEERVDFRELVRDLAAHFHTRVDMRQIGVRDEVRLRGGFGPCGQELCCARFGGKFEPVSIRMAKEQDLPLNSAKISGMCGRLMCCLRYEFEAYKDFKTRAPKRNAVIETALGMAKVVDYNTPRELVTMRLENGKSITVPLAEMQCSQACRKRAEQSNIPLRPDTVTRETLEELGTAEIMAQLAELDRKNNPESYELDSSLLTSSSPRRTERRRNQAAGQGAEKAEARERRSGRAQGPQAGGEQGDERPAQRKGMRPRRSSNAQGASSGAGANERTQQVRGSRGERTQSSEQGGQQGRQRTSRRNHEAQAGTPRTERAAAQGASQQNTRRAGQEQPKAAQQSASQAQHRTRRHHVSAEQQSRPATDAAAAPRERERRDAQGQAQGQGQGAQQPRQRRQHKAAGQASEAQARQQRGGTSAKPQGSPTGGKPTESAGAQGATRRRRRPGDKGGNAAANSASNNS